MNMQLIDLQVLWMIGALERLATLGLLESPPLKVTQKGIDSFLLIDEHRDNLFAGDEEMKNLLKCIILDQNETYDQQLLDDLFYLVKEYKDNRTEFVKSSLEFQ